MNKFDLATHIINKYPGQVSHLKLQKLMYYSYAWQLVALDGKKIFEADFEAWAHGPVERDIYNEYKKFGGEVIPATQAVLETREPVLDFILDSYSVFSAFELSKTTHLEQPWKDHKENGGLIPDADLKAFYEKQVFHKNFPLGEAGKFYPPKTSSHYVFTFDMAEDYVPEFESLEQYLELFKNEDIRLKRWLKYYESQN